MKVMLPYVARDVYESPHVEVLLFEPRSVILGSNGTTQDYDSQNPWDTPDNE